MWSEAWPAPRAAIWAASQAPWIRWTTIRCWRALPHWQSVTGLRRAQFDAEAMTLTTNSMILPISDQVQIYNEATKTWYTAKDGGHPENLQQALAFSDDLSVYYDKTPETGGKVRIIVIK